MTFVFKSITPGYYATIPTYAVRSAKCTQIKVYDTNGRFKLIDNAILKDLYQKHKLAILTDDTGHHYIPSWSYMKYV